MNPVPISPLANDLATVPSRLVYHTWDWVIKEEDSIWSEGMFGPDHSCRCKLHCVKGWVINIHKKRNHLIFLINTKRNIKIDLPKRRQKVEERIATSMYFHTTHLQCSRTLKKQWTLDWFLCSYISNFMVYSMTWHEEACMSPWYRLMLAVLGFTVDWSVVSGWLMWRWSATVKGIGLQSTLKDHTTMHQQLYSHFS